MRFKQYYAEEYQSDEQSILGQVSVSLWAKSHCIEIYENNDRMRKERMLNERREGTEDEKDHSERRCQTGPDGSHTTWTPETAISG